MRKKNESIEGMSTIENEANEIKKLLDNEDENIFEIPTWFLSTGNYSLNYIISGDLFGGYCSGLVNELFGDPSTGKTLLLMVAVANMQKMGGLVVVSDVERRWDWPFAKTHGVDVDRVIKVYPETVEEWSVQTDKILDRLLEKNPTPKVLFILDSVAAISTLWEMENVGTKEDQGKKAKRIKAAMRVIPKKLSRAGGILLTSNHLIADPRITYGSNQITPGGKGISFQASVRIEMHKPSYIVIEGKNRPIGATLKMVAKKTSTCPPLGETTIDTLWSKGINPYSGLLDMAVDLGIVKQGGGWYEYNEKKFRGNQIAEIAKETDLLENPTWKKPYFLSEE
jgi:recombination protein RecA